MDSGERKEKQKATNVEGEQYLGFVQVLCRAGSVKTWIVFILLYSSIHYALQCMSYLSVIRDQCLTICYYLVV